MQHIIKKQVINLSIDKKIDSFYLQQKVSDKYWSRIVPLLQKAFDAASSESETIRVDSIEIDLGIISPEDIEKGNFEEQVLKRIYEQLAELKYEAASKIKVKKETRELSISGQWIFYMKHGYLPWNVLKIDNDWYKKVLESFASDSTAISNLRNLINQYPDSTNRIIFQHNERFLKSLIETLTAKNQNELPSLLNEIIRIFFPKEKNKRRFISSKEKELKQELWRQVLKLSASSTANLKSSKIVGLLLINNFSIEEMGIKKMKDFLLKNKIDTSSFKSIIKDEEFKSPDNITEISEEGIFVTNAGIVLLHSFLNRFFKNLQFINEESFIDEVSHQKALYLLHYLAAGNTKPEEHELVVPKILCAYPLEKPVNTFIKLTTDELKEAESLMASAIGQWEILKSTSPEGLREGFLKRNGKLFIKNESVFLQIETSSIDMLLDHLPWNINMIKLPWMNEILRVEWR